MPTFNQLSLSSLSVTSELVKQVILLINSVSKTEYNLLKNIERVKSYVFYSTLILAIECNLVYSCKSVLHDGFNLNFLITCIFIMPKNSQILTGMSKIGFSQIEVGYSLNDYQTQVVPIWLLVLIRSESNEFHYWLQKGCSLWRRWRYQTILRLQTKNVTRSDLLYK